MNDYNVINKIDFGEIPPLNISKITPAPPPKAVHSESRIRIKSEREIKLEEIGQTRLERWLIRNENLRASNIKTGVLLNREIELLKELEGMK